MLQAYIFPRFSTRKQAHQENYSKYILHNFIDHIISKLYDYVNLKSLITVKQFKFYDIKLFFITLEFVYIIRRN